MCLLVGEALDNHEYTTKEERAIDEQVYQAEVNHEKIISFMDDYDTDGR